MYFHTAGAVRWLLSGSLCSRLNLGDSRCPPAKQPEGFPSPMHNPWRGAQSANEPQNTIARSGQAELAAVTSPNTRPQAFGSAFS